MTPAPEDPKEDVEPAPHPLSETEVAVVRLVATAASNKEIAHQRGISEGTVKKHVTNINHKLDTSNRVEMLLRAIELGLVSVDAPTEAGSHGEAARELAEALERERQRARELEAARDTHGRRIRWLAGAVAVLVVALLTVASGVMTGPAASRPPSPAPERGPSGLTPRWVPSARLPSPRAGLALAAAGGDVWAVGGWDGSEVLADMLRLAPARARWEARAAKPTAIRDGSAAELRGRLIVPGGCDAAGNAVATVEVYDPARDRWESAASLPEPRCGYGLAVLEGQLFLFGGRTGEAPSTASDQVLRYELAEDLWSVVDRLPAPRADLGVAVFPDDDAIHLVGGRDRDGDLERDHWIYRPFAPRPWTEDAVPLPRGRAGHGMAGMVSPVPRIYVVGGGWDGPPTGGASTLGLDVEGAGSWVSFASVPGRTPQRGVGMAAIGRTLYLAGGVVDSEIGLTQDAYQFEPFQRIPVFP